MDFSKFLGEMQKLLTASQQGDLFGNKGAMIENANKACVAYLKGQGYSVGRPNNYPFNIKKADDLIGIFYCNVRASFPEHLWSTPNEKKDRTIAKAFVEKRMNDDGIDKQAALNQCGYIIDKIFKRSDVFKFDRPPNFGILGQAEMSWLTERAVQLINEEITKDRGIAAERKADELTKEIMEKYPKLGYSTDELEAMTKKLEGQYGKKENKS